MLTTTLKNLRARKFRLVTTGFAVLLGVAFVTGTLVLTDTVATSLDNLFADIFDETDGYVRAEAPFDGDDRAGEVRPLIDDSLVEVVRDVDGVALAAPDVLGYAQVVGADGEPAVDAQRGPPTFGTNWVDDERLNAFDIAEGRAPAADGEVVIDAYTADEGDLSVGDRTRVITAGGIVEVDIVGIVRFGEVDSPGGTSWAAFTTEAAQRLVGQPEKLSGITVLAEDGVSEAELRDRIAAALPPDHEAITGDELTEENQDALQGFIDIFRNIMLAFALIALFVGSFIIYNTFSILVAQRTRETALLRAIGASRRQVMGAVLLEAVVVGVVAAVLGMFAGIGLAVGLQALLASFGVEFPSSGLTIKAATVIWALVLGVLVSVFAAWFPARRGSRVPPIAALRDVAFEQPSRSRLRLGLGGLLLVAGMLSLFGGLSGGELAAVGFGALLILLGVAALGPLAARPVAGLLGHAVALRGMSGTLARENAIRNPKRTATTASALLIGVTLVAFITIFASSAKASIDEVFDEQFTGDFVLDAGGFGFGGAPIAMAEELRRLPEVDAVSALRAASAQVDDDSTFLQALDSAEIGRIADIGVIEGDLADLREDGIAVFAEEAEDNGWEIGTTLSLAFAEGDRTEVTVEVLYENDELARRYFVDTSVFAANLPFQFDSLVFLALADGTSLDEARPAIEAVTEQYPNVEMQDRDEFIEAQAGFIDGVLAMVYVLLSLAIVIALFGIANTLALSIVERTRELGLLRAVGMTRGQLRAMIRWEAVIIALFGTIGGLAVGTFFGWAVMEALADEGLTAFNVPVTQLLVIAVLAGFFGVVAALAPARRAARLNVLDAIATD